MENANEKMVLQRCCVSTNVIPYYYYYPQGIYNHCYKSLLTVILDDDMGVIYMGAMAICPSTQF